MYTDAHRGTFTGPTIVPVPVCLIRLHANGQMERALPDIVSPKGAGVSIELIGDGYIPLSSHAPLLLYPDLVWRRIRCRLPHPVYMRRCGSLQSKPVSMLVLCPATSRVR